MRDQEREKEREEEEEQDVLCRKITQDCSDGFFFFG